MLALIRLAIFGLIALTILFWLVRIYARSLRRESLEKEWDVTHAYGETAQPRDAFVEEGMRDYEKSLLRKLIWLVYVLPIGLIAVIVYFMNYR
ncbi:MAG: hypothetical protein H5U24_08555 [Thioclava marina]|jgi:hypothetical protein|uniref:hypothetical protein n=1 Tax=Thioclava TaxID=285107 RepID=UPI000997218E|nr:MULTISPECIES: hypothetical protein [Thioclava]MBC7145443.1 hypothetical protein [Thioclava marina]TNE92970.1 MAG: hypothetical protein EP337_04770 [Paracoccaceae bacterium]TNF15772.1 MAG: hypothetical protein EP320_03535 [Paracoccaceae bacterium]